ncbi:hypothetical protein OIDMADRAFT_21013 [Oidiodendron maius Zn]|uniref:BZIP domain-containing protein n=1 Tax=Oidiodendron maius (strain Zn) TaxID=913774 RepID=A0A0C3GZE0_OIDMZ|nr:hypothetical protein OIDMADRAFT_21013 [Oidiodendron maius Zn]
MNQQQTSSAAATRIRDNQRRSRARRRDYLTDLEKQVQRIDRLGPQPSAEIQAAAQKVLAENVLLRSLLREHGILNAEIESYLHNSHGGSENITTASPGPYTNTMKSPKGVEKPFLPGVSVRDAQQFSYP